MVNETPPSTTSPGGTAGPIRPGETKLERQRRTCIAAGGSWDSATQKCTFPPERIGPNTALEARETPSGTFFGLNKDDIRLLEEQQARKAGRVTPPGTISRVTPPGQVNPLGTAARVAEFEETNIAREEFIGAQFDPLRSTLERQIINPLGTEPEAGSFGRQIGEGINTFGATQGVVATNTIKKGFEKLFGLEDGALGRTTQEQFLETTLPGTDFKPGKFLAKALTVSEAAALVVLGTAAIPLILKTSVGVSLSAKVAASNKAVIVALSAIVGTTLIGGGISKITDIKGKNIDNLKGEINAASGISSSIQSSVQNGMDPIFARNLLLEQVEIVTRAEREIQQLAIKNLEFRTSDEHRDLDADIKNVRINILERVEGVSTLALSGSTTVDSEGLIYDMAKLQSEVNE